MARQRPPSINSTSFSCPQCGSLAHQTWYLTYIDEMAKDKLPFLPDDSTISQVKSDTSMDAETRAHWLEWAAKLRRGEVFINESEGAYLANQLANIWVSQCYSCDKFTLWLRDKIVYPFTRGGEEPNSDLSDDILRDYDEARSVLDRSPRAAAALLRLSIQKICRELGEQGADLNQDIANLVTKGLDVRAQQALDIVRVIGNNAVHPGQIDLRDNRETAMQLFSLVNLIVEKMISEPKHVQTMFDALPETSRVQIAKRGNRR
jgi:hypothetical protein